MPIPANAISRIRNPPQRPLLAVLALAVLMLATLPTAIAETVPTAPRAFLVLSRSTTISFSWDAPASHPTGKGITGYDLYQVSGSTYTFSQTLDPALRSINFGATNGVTYCYALKAVTSAGTSPYTATSCTTPDARATGSANIRGSGGFGWTRSPYLVDVDATGPTYGGAYHPLQSVEVLRRGVVVGHVKYVDELNAWGWNVSATDPIAVPVGSTGSPWQGPASVQVTLPNNPTTSADSEPVITGTYAVDLRAYDRLELWNLYDSDVSLGNGIIDVRIYSNATLIGSKIGLSLQQNGWIPITFDIANASSRFLTKVEITLHEARKTSIPPSPETQTFWFDNLKAWNTTQLRETEDGRSSWTTRITDVDGLVQGSTSITLSLDQTAPVTTSGVSGTLGLEGWYVAHPSVTLSADDATSGVSWTRYQIANGSGVMYASPFTLTGEGNRCFHYWSTDNASNVETKNHACARIDTFPPTTGRALSGTLGSAGWYRSAVGVTLSPTDGTSGVKTTTYELDGGATQTGTSLTVSAPGKHAVTYGSTDNAGNVESRKSVDVWVDATAPTTTSSVSGTAGTNGWYRSSLVVTLSATDATSGVASTGHQLPGETTWRPYTAPFTVEGQGTRCFKYNSTDVAGNAEAPNTRCENLDSVAPVTNLTVFGAKGPFWYRENVTLQLDATDATSGLAATKYRLDGGAVTIGTSVVVSASGNHTIEYWSVDDAGNEEAAKTYAFGIDVAAPTFSGHTPAPGATGVSPSQQVRVNHQDTGGSGVSVAAGDWSIKVEHSFSGLPFVDVTSEGDSSHTDSQTSWRSRRLGGLTAGVYRVTASIADNAGNPATTTWTFTV